MADNQGDKNALIAQFSGITGAAPQQVFLDLTTTSHWVHFLILLRPNNFSSLVTGISKTQLHNTTLLKRKRRQRMLKAGHQHQRITLAHAHSTAVQHQSRLEPQQ